MPRNYQIGLGRDIEDHPLYPGRVNHVYSDNAARGFYERWLELMQEPNDRVMARVGAPCSVAAQSPEGAR